MGSRKAQSSIKQIKDLLGDVVPEKPEKKKKRVTKKKVSAKKKPLPKPSLSDKNLEKLVNEALAIEAEEALEADSVGFMARALTQATMPHSATKESQFTRQNGNFRLTMMAPAHIGLPYGMYPRLLMAWIATEAVKSNSKELILGTSLSEFMGELGLEANAGKTGRMTPFKNQLRKLLATSIYAEYLDDERTAAKNIQIIDSADIWWHPKKPEQSGLFQSVLTLSDGFFREVTENPVPIDMRALAMLKQSPLALDIYCWLTYRMSYLKKPTVIPWPALQAQFGAGYPMTPQGTRDFKKKFLKQLKKVELAYKDVNVSEVKSGFMLKSSKTHVKKLN